VTLLDDFFIRALIGGLGIALVSGPLGCIVVWRRLAYFGDTLAHASILGVVIAVFTEINLMLAVFVVASLVAFALTVLQRRTALASDALLGLLAHATLAFGLVAIALFGAQQVDLMSLLFGDILSMTQQDVLLIFIAAVVILLCLAFVWRSLFATTVSAELAEAEGLSAKNVELVFMLLMAALVALSLKLVGALLITALLLMPAASARRFAKSPESMAIIASLFGCVSVVGGLCMSLYLDTPAGPSIVVFAALVFLITLSRTSRSG